jgi:hypothetical protein
MHPRIVLAAALGMALGLPPASALAQCPTPTPGVPGVATWRLRLQQIRVVRVREASGDRPYFTALVFRSCFGGRGTTRVEVVEREPHDWVSKPEYRGGARLRRGDHMGPGELLAIPEWMGKFEWDGLPLVNVSRGLPTDEPWLFGAVIFSFDNNNTPPHVVRNILNTMRDNMVGLLRQAVERTGAVTWTADQWTAMAAGLAEGVSSFRNNFQLSVGSTFNPDKPTGIQLLAWWGTRSPLTAIRIPTGSLILTLTGGDQVWLRRFVGHPVDTAWTLRFTGAGAEYDVAARFERVGGETVAWRRINARTSPLSLAACSNGRVYVLHADGGLVSTNGSSDSAPWQTHGRLPNAARLACGGTTLFVLGRDRQLFTLPAPTAAAAAPARVGLPHGAATIGGAMHGDFPTPWALNDDRTLWYNGQGGLDGRWTRVGQPRSAARIAGAAGWVFALNDDRTLWVSPTGRDGTWRLIDRPHAAVEITATAPPSGTPVTLFALNGDGSLWRGSVAP